MVKERVISELVTVTLALNPVVGGNLLPRDTGIPQFTLLNNEVTALTSHTCSLLGEQGLHMRDKPFLSSPGRRIKPQSSRMWNGHYH